MNNTLIRRVFSCLSLWIGFFTILSSVGAQSVLTNSGFEGTGSGSTTDWSNVGGTISASTLQKNTGSYSGRLQGRTAANHAITRNLLPHVISGKTYRYSVWVRLGGSGKGVSSSLVIAKTDASGRTLTTLKTASVSGTAWTQFTGTYTYSSNGTATELIAYIHSNTSRDVYIDDAVFEETNLLTNGGFELGTNANWTGAGATISVVSTEQNSGAFSGYVTGRSDNWHGAWMNNLQSILTSGNAYRISMWIKPTAGADLRVQLTTKQTNNGVDVYGPVLQERVCTAGEWTELSGGFKYVNSSTTAVSVYIYCNDDKTRSYYVDDATIRIDEANVDLAAQGGPITQKATGFLHGLGDTVPATTHYESLKPRIQRFPAFLGSPNMLGAPSGFSSAAYMNRLKNVGAKQEVILSDEYMWFGHHTSWGWPGDPQHDGKTPYQILDEKIDSLLDYSLVNFPAASGWQLEWDLWNEPDNADFWGRSQAQFFETWKHAHQRVRAKDPNAVIKGPSIAYFCPLGVNTSRGGWLKSFLLYARDNNVLPDIVSWHEMVNPKEIPDQVQMIRDFMAANGISSRPIDVNEYQGPGNDLMLSPGNTVQFLSQLERTDIRYAIRACWNDVDVDGSTNGLFPGRLDNIMTASPFEPRALWHVYKTYADMSGNKVSVSRGGYLNGFGAVDNASGKAVILVGNDGNQAYSTKLTIRNLSQLANFSTIGKVRVIVREIPYSGLNALSAPTAISNAVFTPIGNTLDVPLNVTSRGAYEITLETGTVN